MNVQIIQHEKPFMPGEFSGAQPVEALMHCLRSSMYTWEGRLNGRIVAVWGLMPSSLISDRAYLWLFTSEEAEAHKFLLVRHSQLMMEEMLSKFPAIYGHCKRVDKRAIQWIKWLGGKFLPSSDRFVQFEIRKRHG